MTDLRIRPLPFIGDRVNAGSYHSIPFDRDDGRSRENLVKLTDYGVANESFYAREDGGNAPYNRKIAGASAFVWTRETVAEKLAQVNETLRPLQLEVFVWDAHRSIECQQGLWDFIWRRAGEEMPGATPEERRQYTLNFVSDPSRFVLSDPATWPVHATGGAVDLTLRSRNTGRLLDMGGDFDEVSNRSYSDAYERMRLARQVASDDPRLVNRRILHAAMESQGFVNYHLEWWHYDYGDQMHVLHARMRGLPDAPRAAFYGYIASPEAKPALR